MCLHVTTAEELPLLAEARDFATVETTPQHLTLAAPECYERLGTYAQMNPPIREARHRDALWKAVSEGLIDVIGSDHAPHTREEKDKIYPNTPSGMPGVQTLATILLDHVNAGGMSLERFVDLTSAGAARIFGIAGKGRIARGFDADFTIVDLKKKRKIENSWIASKCGWTPFDGMETTGWPVATIIRGKTVMRDHALALASQGEPLRFWKRSVQPEFVADMFELRWRNQSARGYPHGMQLAVDAAFPEMQEFVKHGKFRCQIEFLPDEALQDFGMIGHVIKDFGRGQPISAQTQLETTHCKAPSPFDELNRFRQHCAP